MTTTIIKTVKPSGGDYTSLANWETGQQANIVAADQVQECDCYSMVDTAAVSLTGWTTDATHYLLIKGADSDKTTSNTGVYSTSRYRLEVSDAVNISATDVFVRFDYLQFKLTVTTASTEALFLSTDSLGSCIFYVSNCVFNLQGTSTNGANAMVSNSTKNTVYMWNCLAYNPSTATYASSNAATIQCGAGGTISIYSCTIIGGYKAFYTEGAAVTIKNCYGAIIATGATAYATSGGSFTMTTCASSDTSGSAGLQSIARNTTNFKNVTNGSEDYHLAGTGSALYHAGTNTSGDAAPLNFTTDIDGNSRGTTWDVGDDQYSSGTSTYDTPYIVVGNTWYTIINAYETKSGVWEQAQTAQITISHAWV